MVDGFAKDIPGVAAYLLDVANLYAMSDEKFSQTEDAIYANNEFVDKLIFEFQLPIKKNMAWALFAEQRRILTKATGK